VRSPASVDEARWDSYTPIQLCYCLAMETRSTASSEPVPIPHPIGEELAALIAQRFGVLAEPMRIRLLDALRNGPLSVGELVEATGSSQQNVSKHLGILRGAGMVRRTKEGNRAMYEITDHSVFDLCEHVCGGIRRRLTELDVLLAPPSA